MVLIAAVVLTIASIIYLVISIVLMLLKLYVPCIIFGFLSILSSVAFFFYKKYTERSCQAYTSDSMMLSHGNDNANAI